MANGGGTGVIAGKNKEDEGFDYSGMGGDIAKTGLPILMSWILNRGDRKRKGAAEQQQTQIAGDLFKMMQQRHQQDMGVRDPLFKALRGRMAQRQPRMLPGQVGMTNPYRNVQRMQRSVPPPQNPQAQRENQLMPSTGFTPQMLRERMRRQQFQGNPAQNNLGEAIKRQLIGRPPQVKYDPQGNEAGYTG
jgi:hypothetical protein